MDLDLLLAQEDARKYELYGDMDPGMYREIEETQASRMRRVLIKMDLPEEFIDKNLKPKLVENQSLAQKQTLEQKARERYRSMVSSLGAQSASQKVEVSGPFIVTEISSEELLSFARAPEIVYIGPYDSNVILDQVGYSEYTEMEDAFKVSRTNHLQNSYNLSGSGIRIAVTEFGQTSREEECYNVVAKQSYEGNPYHHMSLSLAMWGTTYQTQTSLCDGPMIGYAPGAGQLMANKPSNDPEYPHGNYAVRYQWAKDNGADIISMSWHLEPDEEVNGTLSARDIYFDYWSIRWPYPAVFTSAGNEAFEFAYASGKGYNFLGVGNMAFDTSVDNRCDDQIYDESSYYNPISPYNDREIPEIAAPGARHAVCGDSFGGTSAATAAVSGISALLLEGSSHLKNWPEALRAVLIATANYQMGDWQNWSRYSDGRDGTGMVNALYAHLTAKKRETGTAAQYRAHDYGSMSVDDFDQGTYEKTWTARNNNAPIRVALTWNSKTTQTSSVLDVDLDLWLVNSSGTIVATSTSFDGSYEFLEYMPSAGDGNLTIKIKGYNIPQDLSTYYSVAWTTHYDCY